MKLRSVVTLLVIILLPLATLAQRSTPRKSGTIEGVVVDVLDGAHEIGIVVESGGIRYEFCVACRGTLKDSPTNVGGEVTVVGTRVRVRYVNLTRSRDGSVYYVKALRVTKLRTK